jgi:hypothetical protein
MAHEEREEPSRKLVYLSRRNLAISWHGISKYDSRGKMKSEGLGIFLVFLESCVSWAGLLLTYICVCMYVCI